MRRISGRRIIYRNAISVMLYIVYRMLYICIYSIIIGRGVKEQFFLFELLWLVFF